MDAVICITSHRVRRVIVLSKVHYSHKRFKKDCRKERKTNLEKKTGRQTVKSTTNFKTTYL